MNIQSYVMGEWYNGQGNGVEVVNAVNGDFIGSVTSDGMEFGEVLRHAREAGGPALRRMTLHERALRLKALAQHLLEHKDEFYQVSAWTGATRADSWIDIEGGIGTLFSYSSLVRREFPNETFLVEGGQERLSKQGTFTGRHILVPREGAAVHINAFNFPCWGCWRRSHPACARGCR